MTPHDKQRARLSAYSQGVAPFRGFVQERVALARRAIEKSGPDALNDWAPMYLFYGCRKSTEDFLYADEWPKYQQELKGKFIMHTAFSREMKKDDGSESKQTSLPVNAQTDNGAFL